MWLKLLEWVELVSQEPQAAHCPAAPHLQRKPVAKPSVARGASFLLVSAPGAPGSQPAVLEVSEAPFILIPMKLQWFSLPPSTLTPLI